MPATLTLILNGCPDLDLRRRISQIIRTAGYATLEADSSDEVLALARPPVQLVLLAGHWRGCARAIRNHAGMSLVPVVSLADEDTQNLLTEELLLNKLRQLAPLGTGVLSRETLTLIRELIDGLTAHVAVLNEQGEILAVNASWRAFGRVNCGNLSELCEGANYVTACENACGTEESEAKDFVRGLRDVLTGRILEFTHEYPCHSAIEYRWFVARVSRVQVSGQRFAMVAHENITDRKRVEEALDVSNKRIIDILDSIPDGMAATDQLGRFTYLNLASERYLGILREQCLGQRVEDIIGHPIFPQTKERNHLAKERNHPILPQTKERSHPMERRAPIVEEHFFRRVGVWVEVYAYPATEGWLLHLRDVTQRHMVQESETRAHATRLEALQGVQTLQQPFGPTPSGDGVARPAMESSDRAAEWIDFHGKTLELALEQRTYRIDNRTSWRVRQLAARMGAAGAGPREVIDAHARAVAQCVQGAEGRAAAYYEEGRLLLLELMGGLASYYRDAVGSRE